MIDEETRLRQLAIRDIDGATTPEEQRELCSDYEEWARVLGQLRRAQELVLSDMRTQLLADQQDYAARGPSARDEWYLHKASADAAMNVARRRIHDIANRQEMVRATIKREHRAQSEQRQRQQPQREIVYKPTAGSRDMVAALRDALAPFAALDHIVPAGTSRQTYLPQYIATRIKVEDIKDARKVLLRAQAWLGDYMQEPAERQE